MKPLNQSINSRPKIRFSPLPSGNSIAIVPSACSWTKVNNRFCSAGSKVLWLTEEIIFLSDTAAVELNLTNLIGTKDNEGLLLAKRVSLKYKKIPLHYKLKKKRNNEDHPK